MIDSRLLLWREVLKKQQATTRDPRPVTLNPRSHMLRTTLLAALIALCSESPSPVHDVGLAARYLRPATHDDVHALITAAHGASPLLCSYAVHSVGNGGWGWDNAPVTPLPHDERRSSRFEPLAPDDVQFLLTNIGSGDPCVSEIAVRLLAGDESPAATDGLIRNLGSADSSARMVAALGLGLSAPDRAAGALINVVNDKAAGVRANAIWALGRIGDGRAVRPATGALRDPSPAVREAAAGTLGQLDSTSTVAALARVLADDEIADVRRTAAWALGQIEAREAVSALSTALHADRDTEVREMSAWALGNIEARSAGAALLAAAQGDADESVRETAVWALGNIEDDGAAEALGRLVTSDKSRDVRETAAWALGQLDLRTAPKGLLDALADPDAELRIRAAWALGEIGDEAALPVIRTALGKEQDARARKAEIRALIHSGERPEALQKFLTSNDPRIRETAIRGMVGDGGLDPWPWPMPRPRPFP